VRDEIREHCAALSCTHVVGYTESVAYHDGGDLIVLSGVGTAVKLEKIGTGSTVRGAGASGAGGAAEDRLQTPRSTSAGSVADRGGGAVPSTPNLARTEEMRMLKKSAQRSIRKEARACPFHFCHVPYNHMTPPFKTVSERGKASLSHQCRVCRKHHVPEVLLSTMEPPAGKESL
jgi:hypothetical protein